MDPQKDFSQHGEQKIIQDFFLAHPPAYRIFVDVGALDITFSNTAALAFSGWRGLMFEPHPVYADCLKRQLKDTKVEVFNCAIGDEENEADLYIHRAFGHDSLLKTWYPLDKTLKTIRVQVKQLPRILLERKIPLDFDFLSIDAEGYDKNIITNLFQTSAYRPTLITVELTSFKEDFKLFTTQGYHLIQKTGPNDFGNWTFSKI